MSQHHANTVAALLERLGRLLSADGHSPGLNPVQWESLRYLSKANRYSNTAIALAAYLGLTKGTVSQTVASLEKKGLVRKTPDSHDKRSVRLSLMPQGKRLLNSDPLENLVDTISELPERTQEQLAKNLSSLLVNHLVAQDRKAFGQCHSCQHFARDHADGGPHWCLLVNEKLSDADSIKICAEHS